MTAPIILALGDSLIAGYGLPPSDAFPPQLERALRRTSPAARVINAGVSGDTSASGLARLPRVLSSLAFKPDLAIVTLVANDMLRGTAISSLRSNLDMILHTLAQATIPAFLIGLVAPAFAGPHAERFNAVYPALAEAHRVPLFSFPLVGVVGNPALTLRDRLHPNGAAIGMVVADVLPLILEALDGRADRAA